MVTYQLWQNNVMVVEVDAPTEEQAKREINHYAMMYSQDGAVKIVKKKSKEVR